MKPQIHLLGDKFKAAKFIKFAERKLAEMKGVMRIQRLSMQNKIIRFTTDSVEVFIESYFGYDKIRIEASGKVVCDAGFTVDVQSGSSPLSVTFSVSKRHFSQTENEFIDYIWDFGDGTFSRVDEENVIHEYVSAGTYTVKLTVLDKNRAVADIPHYGFIVTRLSQVAFTKTGRGGTNSAAHTAFLAAPWVSVAADNGLYTAEYSNFPFGTSTPILYTATRVFSEYSLIGNRLNSDYLLAGHLTGGLDNVEGDFMVRALDYQNTVTPSTITLGIGPASHVPVGANTVTGTTTIADLTPYFNNQIDVVAEVTDKNTDTNSFPILTDPGTTDINGWIIAHAISGSSSGHYASNMGRPYVCRAEKIREALITVT